MKLQLSALVILLMPGVWSVANASPSGAFMPSIETIAEKCRNITSFNADVEYTVSLAMTNEDVSYSLHLADSVTIDAPSISPVDYLIEWKLNRGETSSDGFSAYYSGHYYNFRAEKLQEYHYDWDSIPFISGGGVHTCGQFVGLLPQFIGKELLTLANNPDFSYTISQTNINGNPVTVIDGTEQVQDVDARHLQYTFDSNTWLPVKLFFEYNPSQISEQSVTALYSYPQTPSVEVLRSEQQLIDSYPNAFANFRQSNYRIENLRQHSMPGFSLPTTTGERYTYAKADGFTVPTVIALIDPAVATAGQTVTALRKVRNSLPCETNLILAFMSSNIDAIEAVAPDSVEGEYILMSAKSLARDCGANAFPTIIIVDTNGIVNEILLGFNNSIAENVIQSIALIHN